MVRIGDGARMDASLLHVALAAALTGSLAYAATALGYRHAVRVEVNKLIVDMVKTSPIPLPPLRLTPGLFDGLLVAYLVAAPLTVGSLLVYHGFFVPNLTVETIFGPVQPAPIPDSFDRRWFPQGVQLRPDPVWTPEPVWEHVGFNDPSRSPHPFLLEHSVSPPCA